MSIADTNTVASGKPVPDNIPPKLRDDQSVLWKTIKRNGKPTKVPYQPNGQEAKSNDPKTWSPFAGVWRRYEQGGYDGVGFVFSHYDPDVGIDLDGCRDPETGVIDEWAADVISTLNTYSEVSPSGSGVKCFVKGRSPFDTGKKKNLDHPPRGGKNAGIEIYSNGRYFALTGWRLRDFPETPQERDLQWIREEFWPSPARINGTAAKSTSGPQADVIERARRYVATMPEAISGSSGHDATFAVACVLVLGFGLEEDDALTLLREYSDRCKPPWSEHELQHKIKSAGQQSGERNYLRDSTPEQWDRVVVPQYSATDLKISKTEVDAKKHKPLQYKRITCAELDAGNYNLEYLIEHTLVAGQPCIVAGGKKCLKTSLILDMGISLAMGGFFLGKLKVNRACKVGIMTGESGLATIQEVCRRICTAAGYKLSDIGGLVFSEDLPRFGSVAHEDALRRWLMDDEIEVVVLDPAYLCLPGADAGNLFAQGDLLRGMSKVCSDCGCTMILCHHTRKTKVDPFSPPELEDIAWAGFQEFARQWLLVGRREQYEPGTGTHHLWLSVGGSAGHTSLWALNIEEGTREHDGGRWWDVDVMRASEARDEVQDRKEAAKEEQQLEQLKRDMRTICDAIVKYPGGETKTVIRDVSGLHTRRFNAAFGVLLADQDVMPCEITKHNRKKPYDAYKLNGVTP